MRVIIVHNNSFGDPHIWLLEEAGKEIGIIATGGLESVFDSKKKRVTPERMADVIKNKYGSDVIVKIADDVTITGVPGDSLLSDSFDFG
jgi:hypothetical protein